jgi:hypothetical protein
MQQDDGTRLKALLETARNYSISCAANALPATSAVLT